MELWTCYFHGILSLSLPSSSWAHSECMEITHKGSLISQEQYQKHEGNKSWDGGNLRIFSVQYHSETWELLPPSNYFHRLDSVFSPFYFHKNLHLIIYSKEFREKWQSRWHMCAIRNVRPRGTKALHQISRAME